MPQSLIPEHLYGKGYKKSPLKITRPGDDGLNPVLYILAKATPKTPIIVVAKKEELPWQNLKNITPRHVTGLE
jgi:hypothetical protein